MNNMYDNVKTINFLNGECPHKCIYCSSKSLRPNVKSLYQGGLCLNENAFKRSLGKGNTWFVCSQNDLFAGNIISGWVNRIIGHCKRFDNAYLFQTKCPSSYKFFDYPQKSVLGTTIETNRYYKKLYAEDTPSPKYRANSIGIQKNSFQRDTFITIEPILDFDLNELIALINEANPNWVWIGADSKKHHLPEPSKEKILALIEELKKFTEVRLKSNLNRLLK